MTVVGDMAVVFDTLMGRTGQISSGSPSLPISWPEKEFTTPDDGRYLEVIIFPNRPSFEGLASGRVDQGLLQISVVWPKGEGVIAAMEIADEVAAQFYMGSRFGRIKVYRQPWISTPLSEDDRVKIPITIPWVSS